MSPVFNPLRQSATYEAVFEVSAVPVLQIRPRLPDLERPDARMALAPREVALCYVYVADRWVPSGIRIKGMSLGRMSPLTVLFTPDTDFEPVQWDVDVPVWALDLVDRMTPTGTPG